ncbi:DUF4254 domain-containing protein [Pseudonocardiaceae bacterium YIM PH 21723]|nr:DUF4254 domain-containing protein [Pseudonocardiaceae bacterium YIM PH 21723]
MLLLRHPVDPVPPGLTTVLPGSGALLDAITGQVPAKPGGHPLLVMAQRLGAQHGRQWDAEDRCRQDGVTDACVAMAKRVIDELNGLRSRCIDEIDDWCDRRLPAAGADIPVHTETVGSVVDRLAIASVRAERLGTGPAAAQLQVLVDAYDLLAAELVAGARRVPSLRTLKTYGAGR